jgi:hypothetical protein
MRPPLSRDRLARRADVVQGFRGAAGQASSASGHVCWRHCGLLVCPRDGTTDVLRVSRKGEGSAREWAWCAAPANPLWPLLPSDANAGRLRVARPFGAGAGAVPPESALRGQDRAGHGAGRAMPQANGWCFA